jgi:hypothetical protein
MRTLAYLFALRLVLALLIADIITGWFMVGRAIEVSTHGVTNGVLTLLYAFVLLVLFTMLIKLAWAMIMDTIKAVSFRLGWLPDPGDQRIVL